MRLRTCTGIALAMVGLMGAAEQACCAQPAPPGPGQSTSGLTQGFPSKLVRFVMPFAVGGSSDANGRIIAPPLTERWKQQVLIEPRPGAATVVGTDVAAKSPPDGHTLLITSTQYSQIPALFAKLPFDPLVGSGADHTYHTLAAGHCGASIAAGKKHPGTGGARACATGANQHGQCGRFIAEPLVQYAGKSKN